MKMISCKFKNKLFNFYSVMALISPLQSKQQSEPAQPDGSNSDSELRST